MLHNILFVQRFHLSDLTGVIHVYFLVDEWFNGNTAVVFCATNCMCFKLPPTISPVSFFFPSGHILFCWAFSEKSEIQRSDLLFMQRPTQRWPHPPYFIKLAWTSWNTAGSNLNVFLFHLPSWATMIEVVMFFLIHIALKLPANCTMHSWSLAPERLFFFLKDEMLLFVSQIIFPQVPQTVQSMCKSYQTWRCLTTWLFSPSARKKSVSLLTPGWLGEAAERHSYNWLAPARRLMLIVESFTVISFIQSRILWLTSSPTGDLLFRQTVSISTRSLTAPCFVCAAQQ